MAFVTGPDVRPFVRTSQRPIELLESMTPVDIGLSVPVVRITEVDRSGHPVGGRPITLDLTEPPRFGDPVGRHPERPLVSLENLRVETDQQTGIILTRKVALDFVVHRPDVVFSGDDDLSTWRHLLREGTPFLLEYGWTGRSTNDLLNGVGFHDDGPSGGSGIIVPSTTFMVFVVSTYTFSMQANGELRFNLQALESWDSVLRTVRLGQLLSRRDVLVDDVRSREGRVVQVEEGTYDRDRMSMDAMKSQLAAVVTARSVRGVGDFVRFGDVADVMFDPLIRSAAAMSGFSRVDLFIGNFNADAGHQKLGTSRERMATRSIADFLVPRKDIQRTLAEYVRAGAQITLLNFISTVVSGMNEPGIWEDGLDLLRPGAVVRQPNVTVRTQPFRLHDGGMGLALYVIDVYDGVVRFDDLDVQRTSRTEVIERVRKKGVPIVRFGHSSSYIQDMNFEVIIDEPIKAVRIESSHSDRKHRVELAETPSDQRAGHSEPEQFVPMSVVQGEMTMFGNFVFETFGTVWLDLPVRQTAGVFNVRGRVDNVSRAGFTTAVTVISEGLDPLGTRRRSTEGTLRARAAALGSRLASSVGRLVGGRP